MRCSFRALCPSIHFVLGVSSFVIHTSDFGMTSLPGIAKNHTIPRMSGFGSMIDLLPTLYEFGQGNMESIEKAGDVDGSSLAGLLRGRPLDASVVDLYVHLREDPAAGSGCSGVNNNGASFSSPIQATTRSGTSYTTPPYAPASIANDSFSFCYAASAPNTTYSCVRSLRRGYGNLSSNTLYW